MSEKILVTQYIMDPTDPTKINPDFPDPITPPSLLSLNHVSSFTFGGQYVSASNQTYYSTNTAPFIQVTDIRGSQSGWSVIASMSAFNDGTNPSLNGATLSLNNGTSQSTMDGNLNGPTSPAVLLVSGGDSALVSNAALGSGMGTWLTSWLDDTAAGGTNAKVSLYVPAASMKTGTHNATITWTLSNAPQ